jgi:hypothetical protein
MKLKKSTLNDKIRKKKQIKKRAEKPKGHTKGPR